MRVGVITWAYPPEKSGLSRAAREIARQDIRTVEVGRGGQQAGVSGAEATLRLARIDLANTVSPTYATESLTRLIRRS